MRSTAAIVTMPSKKRAEAQVLVLLVLVVVEVHVGTSIAGKAERLDERRDRHGAAERAQLHRRLRRTSASRPRPAPAPADRQVGVAERADHRTGRASRAILAVRSRASRRPGRRRRDGSPALDVRAQLRDEIAPARVSFTRRMSIAAVARSGMIVRALGADERARPARGCSASASAARPAAWETPARARRRRSACSMRAQSSGTASSIARSAGGQRRDARRSSRATVTRPSSSFIDASSAASRIAGFGIQLP